MNTREHNLDIAALVRCGDAFQELHIKYMDVVADNARLKEALEKIVTENIGCWSGDQDAPERPDSCDKMVEIAEQALKGTYEEADQKRTNRMA